MSPITEFYAGKTVFITGATGYMGKVLLEKLVRSLPDIKKIYILIRPKKGCTPQERVKQLTDGLIFTFHNMNQRAYDKIEAISGDITKENFDMSEIDKKKLIEEVSIVFHVAASVRMDLSLKEAVITNTKSTYQLFKFCMNIKELKSVVHLSTAFCNVEVSYMEEKVYPLNVDPYKIMDLVEWMDDKSLACITKNLLGPHPNTYTFTKRLSEIIAEDIRDKIPLIITRPSIVTPSVKEPIAGWADNFNGPVGLFYAGGKGILRVAYIDQDLVPQTIPVDVAINNLIVSGYERATNMHSSMVLNVTNGNVDFPSWRDYFVRFNKINKEYPYKYVIWYPRFAATKSYYVYMTYMILFQIFPALVIDLLLIMFLQKPFLISIQKRLLATWNVLQHFTIKKWSFDNTNSLKLNEQLHENDRDLFYMKGHLEEIEFDEYINAVFEATNKYLTNETSDNYTLYKIRDKIITSPHPNTYTFTKRLSEIIAKDMGDKLPIVITRPSIVVPALYEPIAGWVDNFYGPIGLLIAAGKGVLKTALVDRNLSPQVIPVDIAINGLILAGYERSKQKHSETPTFNLTQGNLYDMSWGEVFDVLLHYAHKYPFKTILWYPRYSVTTNYNLNVLLTYIFHFIPAYFIDFLLIIFLQKPFLVNIQKRIFAASKVLYHFAVKKWEFSIDNLTKSTKELTNEDKEKFYSIDLVNIDVQKYLREGYFSARKYLIKDYDENLDIYRIRNKILFVVDAFLKILFLYWIINLFLSLIR